MLFADIKGSTAAAEQLDRARLATLTGDTEAAGRYRATSIEVIDTIVSSIVDESLAMGLRSRWKADLDRGIVAI